MLRSRKAIKGRYFATEGIRQTYGAGAVDNQINPHMRFIASRRQRPADDIYLF